MRDLHVIVIEYLHPVNCITPRVWIQSGKTDTPVMQLSGAITDAIAGMIGASEFGLIRQDMWHDEGFTGYDGKARFPAGGCTAIVRLTHHEYDPYKRRGEVIVEVLCCGVIIIQTVAYGQWRDGVPVIATEEVLRCPRTRR